jgi:hypothetical protein
MPFCGSTGVSSGTSRVASCHLGDGDTPAVRGILQAQGRAIDYALGGVEVAVTAHDTRLNGIKSTIGIGSGIAQSSLCRWPESPVTEAERLVPAEAVLRGP